MFRDALIERVNLAEEMARATTERAEEAVRCETALAESLYDIEKKRLAKAERRNIYKQRLAKRAEEAKQALELKCEMLERRARTAESHVEELHSLIAQFLQNPLNETTETTAGGPPKKRARNEQPEENTEN
jgi:hypothetical protein